MAGLITAWSFSRYSTFNTCPFKAKRLYIDRVQEPSNAAMQRGSDIHKEISDYFTGVKTRVPKSLNLLKDSAATSDYFKLLQKLRKEGKVFSEEQKALNSSLKEVEWFAKNAWLRCIYDLRVIISDTEMDMIDWKTGKMRDGYEEQVELFAFTALVLWPQLEKVNVRLLYVDSAGSTLNTYTRKSDFKKLEKKWMAKGNKITTAKTFAAKKNQYCKWCFFRKGNESEGGGGCKVVY